MKDINWLWVLLIAVVIFAVVGLVASILFAP